MIKYFKAEFYRIMKQKSLLLPVLLGLSLGVLFSYFMKDSKGESGTTLIISSLTLFIPLFFVTVANLFWGEGFTSRTINTMVIKSKSRFLLFLYKFFSTLLFSTFYILLIMGTVVVARWIFTGELMLFRIARIVAYQSPYYFCIILMSIFIFNYVEKVYQGYLIYIIIVLLFDNLFSYVMSSALGTDSLNAFFLFNQLKAATGSGPFWSPSVTVALIFSLIYFVVSLYLFDSRELK